MEIISVKDENRWLVYEASIIDLIVKANAEGKEPFFVCITEDFEGVIGYKNMCFIPVGDVKTKEEFAKKFIAENGIASLMCPLFAADKINHDAERAGKEVPYGDIIIVSSVPAATKFFNSVINSYGGYGFIRKTNDNLLDPYVSDSEYSKYGLLLNAIAHCLGPFKKENGVMVPKIGSAFDEKTEKIARRIIDESKAEDADEGSNC